MAEVVALAIAVIAAAGAITGAIIAARSAREARDANRVDQLEARLDQSERNEHLLYLWNRELVDHIWKGKPPPPPGPPPGLFTKEG